MERERAGNGVHGEIGREKEEEREEMKRRLRFNEGTAV